MIAQNDCLDEFYHAKSSKSTFSVKLCMYMQSRHMVCFTPRTMYERFFFLSEKVKYDVIVG